MFRFNENNEVLREDEYNAILVGLRLEEDITDSMEELRAWRKPPELPCWDR